MDYRMGGYLHGQAEPRGDRKKPFRCEKCKHIWMIEHRVAIREDFQVLMGQELPEMDGVSFRIYECVSCGHYNMPPLAYTGTDAIARLNAELAREVKDANERRKASCKCGG